MEENSQRRAVRYGSKSSQADEETTFSRLAGSSLATSTGSRFQLTKDDVVAAFNFFDFGETGQLTTTNLKARLSAFYPNLTSKEYRFLLEDTPNPIFSSGAPVNSMSPQNGRGSAGLNVDQLWELIDSFQRLYMNPNEADRATVVNPAFSTPATVRDNAMQAVAAEAALAFDPVQEAFHVYDPEDAGAMDVQVLALIMARIGFGELSAEDLELLVQTADFDGDGEITIEDFRRLVSMKARFQKEK